MKNYPELVASKMAAGLSRTVAEDCARAQIRADVEAGLRNVEELAVALGVTARPAGADPRVGQLEAENAELSAELAVAKGHIAAMQQKVIAADKARDQTEAELAEREKKSGETPAKAGGTPTLPKAGKK